MVHSTQQMKHENAQSFGPIPCPILRPDIRPSHKNVSPQLRSGEVRQKQWPLPAASSLQLPHASSLGP